MQILPRFSFRELLCLFVVGLFVSVSALPASAATLGASSQTIDFGSVPVSSDPAKNLTVTNRGTTSVKITQVSATGSFKSEGVTLPLTLTAGKSVTFQVRFLPRTAGTVGGTLSVTSNAPKVSVALRGTGIAPGTLTISPISLSFGNVNVGATSTKVTNLKATNHTVYISAASTTNTEFSLSGVTLPLSIGPGKTVAVNVNFKPKSSGTSSGQISFANNSSKSQLVMPASGTGVAASTQHSTTLNWSPASNVAGYNVYRGTATGGPYSKLNSSKITGTSFLDTSVQGGRTYFYVATSVNSAGAESAKSQEVRAVIPTP